MVSNFFPSLHLLFFWFFSELLQSVPCIHENVLTQPDYQKTCNNPLFTKIAWAEHIVHSDQDRDAAARLQYHTFDLLLDTTCCAYRQWEQCSTPIMTEKCNDQSKAVYLETISKLMAGLPDFMCSKKLFTEGSKFCSQLPPYEKMASEVNLSYGEELKFSIFSILKMFLKTNQDWFWYIFLYIYCIFCVYLWGIVK